jgi:Flp pilus assembly protein TadD
MTVWPFGLGVLYPHPGAALPLWKPLVSLLLIALVTALAVRRRREQPSLAVGWLWFLGTLVPVIGLVQVGEQALADRYTYVPLVGLFIVAAWGASDLVARMRWRTAWTAAAAGLALAALMTVAGFQLTHWRNNLSLYGRAVAVSPGSWMMRANLGAELQALGRLDEAIVHLRALAVLRPELPEAHHNLAFALQRAGLREEAVTEFRETLRLNPSHPRADYNLGMALMSLGRPGEAVPHLYRAAQLRPGFVNAHLQLGEAWMRLGRRDEAREAFLNVIRLEPRNAAALGRLETLGAR